MRSQFAKRNQAPVAPLHLQVLERVPDRSEPRAVKRTSDRHVLLGRIQCSSPADSPAAAMRRVRAISSSLMPCSAAFSCRPPGAPSAGRPRRTSPYPRCRRSSRRSREPGGPCRLRRVCVRAVHLSDQRRQHRRAGRNFGHLDARAVLLRDRVSSCFRTRLAISWLCELAVALRKQVHLDVRPLEPRRR